MLDPFFHRVFLRRKIRRSSSIFNVSSGFVFRDDNDDSRRSGGCICTALRLLLLPIALSTVIPREFRIGGHRFRLG